MRYGLVIFDLDGTILDTLDDLTNSLNYALCQNGYREHTRGEVRGFVGNGIRKLMERAVPEIAGEEDINRVHQCFTNHYREHCADLTKPYAGIPELLKGLNGGGVLTAVVSNKADYAVQSLCSRYFDSLLDMAVGERPGVRKKPCPDSVNEVLEGLGIDRSSAVYVGDSEVDIETAANAGMDCIIVDWGFRERDFLISRGAKVVSTVQELLAAMQ